MRMRTSWRWLGAMLVGLCLPWAARAGVFRTTDPAAAAVFMAGAQVESFDDLPAFAISSYDAGQTIDPGARFNTRDGVTRPTFNSGGGSFNDPLGNPGTPIVILDPEGTIAGDVVTPDHVAGPVVVNDPLQPFANGFIEVFFVERASRVGFWVTHGSVVLTLLDDEGNGFTSGDSQARASQGEFVGIDRGAAEIKIATILPDGVSAITIDDFVWSEEASLLDLSRRMAFAGELVGNDENNLETPVGAALSPDGRNLYVASTTNDRLVVFARDPQTGLLSFVEEHRDGVSGISGLDSPRTAVVSPDGTGVYVITASSTLVAFTRDPSDGALTYLQTLAEGVAGVSGISNPYDLEISPDGEQIYVAGHVSQAVAIFDRDAQTGLLQYRGAITDGLLDLGELPHGTCMSPDGRSVYVASFFDTIVAYARDLGDGSLSFVEAEPFESDTHYCAVSPDNRHLYTGSREGVVRILSREPTSGALEPTGEAAVGTPFARPMELSADGATFFAHVDDGLEVFARDPATGSLVSTEEIRNGAAGVQGIGSGIGPSPEVPLVASADGRHLYVMGPGDGAIGIFSAPIYRPTGSVQRMVDGQGGSAGEPRAIAVSPDGRFVYVAAWLTDSIAVYEIDEQTDELVYLEHETNGAIDPASGLVVSNLVGTTDLAMSPDGGQVYAAAELGDAVVWFDRQPDGSLVYRGSYPDARLDGATGVRVAADGLHVYATGRDADAWVAFDRAVDGSLTLRGPVGDTFASGTPSGLAVAPDDGFVMLAEDDVDGGGGGLDIYRRESSGDLTYLRGFGFEDRARRVAFASDGGDFYVTLAEYMGVGGGIRHFRWDSTLEDVVGISLVANAPGGAIDGIGSAYGVAVSPDDRHVAVAGSASGGIALFARNEATGELVLAQKELHGILPDQGLEGAQDVAFTPDGHYLLVSGGLDNEGTLALWVPEPGLLPAVAAGLASLAAMGRRRGGRRRPSALDR